MKITLAMLAVAAFAASGTAHAQKSAEEELGVHRIQSTNTTTYDAWAHVDRIQPDPSEGATAEDYAGMIIFSRLSNLEGRIQVKTLKGFGRDAYLGYKAFMRAWPEPEQGVGNCVTCHTPSTFTDGASHIIDESGISKETPTLRDHHKTNADLEAIIRQKVKIALAAQAGNAQIDQAYQLIKLGDEDITNIVAFLQSLNTVTKEEFRNLILNAEILDTTDIMK